MKDMVVIELDPEDAEGLADHLVISTDHGFRDLAEDIYGQIIAINRRKADHD